jgi:hypothetical protein
MGFQWDKQPASRIIKFQNLAWAGTGTVASTNFTAQTYQIRICSQIPIWFSVDNSTGSGALLATVPTTAGGLGAFLPNSTVGGEYFTVSPGQIFTFASTTTSTGVGTIVSLQEMA